MKPCCKLTFLLGLLWALPAAWASEPFELRDRDRVVLVGGTLIERAQNYGYLETRFTTRFPERHVTFRNLGWSGDTVFGDSRAGFDTAREGYQRLIAHVRELEPTVIVVAYGANESFAGEPGLARFREGLDRLLDDLAGTGARFVLLAPPRHEALGSPLPDSARTNAHLQLYGKHLRRVAAERGLAFADLFALLPDRAAADPACPLTDNGIHHTPYGYWRLAAALERGLGLERPRWHVALDRAGHVSQATGTTLSDVVASSGSLAFTAVDQHLPLPPPRDEAGCADDWAWPRFQVTGLAQGTYTLRVDDQPVATARAAEWAEGVTLRQGPPIEQAEALRDAIRRKNELYFHRWRPQNETYLFGFRKHEQGQNAVEIPQFDPLIDEQEQAIAQLRRPRPHRYELRLEKEVSR